MDHNFDIIVVAAFGRGHWLSSELKAMGMNIALVDLDEARWVPEDREGPFGFFKTDRLKSTQTSWLAQGGDFTEVATGFNLWLKEGPLELKGPVSKLQRENLNVDLDVENYLYEVEKNPAAEALAEQRRQLRLRPFDENWLAQLSHNLASTRFSGNSQSLPLASPLPLFAPYYYCSTTRRGLETVSQRLENLGVYLFSNPKPVDIRFDGKVVHLSVDEGRSQLRSRLLVWGLTSSHTARLSADLARKLFPGGSLQPDWAWIRFRFEVDNEQLVTALPFKVCMIDDIHQPWTHFNLCLMQKASRTGAVDLWIRIPNHKRFEKPYLERMAQELESLVKQRLPGGQSKCSEMPQEYLYSDEVVGPARFPVYGLKQIRGLKQARHDNLFFDGPENWRRLDIVGQYEYQSAILENIGKWIEKNQMSSSYPDITGESNDRTIHSP